MAKISAVVLAAGKGTRMAQSKEGSEIPKVMYEVLGFPMLQYSLENLKMAGINDLWVVDGYKREIIEKYFGDQVNYVYQSEQLGTGHAVLMAEGVLKDRTDAVLVCYGDMPLFKSNTIKKLVELFEKSQAGEKPAIAMLTVDFQDPTFWAYGRIKRDKNGEVVAIVEQKDCSNEELLITECNPGFYIFDSGWLWENIHQLKTENVQREYYLTDLIQIAKKEKRKILTVSVSEETEALGVNTQEQLRQAEHILQLRQNATILKAK